MKPVTYLCIADIFDCPSPLCEEFQYIVCEPICGELHFYSGHTHEAAAYDVAEEIDGIVLKVNLEGVVNFPNSGETQESTKPEQ